MKKLILFAILAGVVAGFTGCGDEATQKEAEKKAKREHMIQPINSKSDNAPTKLPF